MTVSQYIEKDWINLLWFASTIVLIVFLLKRGWRAMPRWQRNYALCAVVVIPLFEIVNRLPIPDSGPIFVGAAILYFMFAAATWWGIGVGIAQTWALLRPAQSN
jgi:hypothetical protein